jgi:hypothetical protein
MVCSSAMQQLGCTGTRPKCPIRQLPAQIQGAIGSAVPVGGAETCGSNHFAGLWTPGLRNCVERCAPRYVYPLLAIAKSSLVESLGEPWAFLVVAGGDRHDAPAIAGGGRSPRADVAAG